MKQDRTKQIPAEDRPRCATCGIRPRQRRTGKVQGGFFTKCSLCRSLARIARTGALRGSDYGRGKYLTERSRKNAGYVLVNGQPI